MKILIVEDEKEFAQSLKDQLKSEYAVDLAFSAEEGNYHSKEYDYDVIIMDIGLPDKNGIVLCKELRKKGIKSPIIMLTGEFAVAKKIEALDNGADDYLVKPFDLEELQARLRALLRRRSQSINTSTLTVGDLSIDTKEKTVKRAGKQIALQRKEFQILEYFMRNPGKLVTRSTLLEHVWDSENDSVANVVDVHIKYLRDRIDRTFSKKLIKTVYGLGYKIEG
ncbi:response regulator transcription factor [Candidatus Roizmanbacteria bacterium]|nr:response regulator transcription factor [Candidatus Roizmanbacteria bacterium]